jgi:hypothetical protein
MWNIRTQVQPPPQCLGDPLFYLCDLLSQNQLNSFITYIFQQRPPQLPN